MRALLRADLHPGDYFQQLWEDDKAYAEAVVKLFKQIGYSKIKVDTDVLQDEKIKNIIVDMPDEVTEEETRRLIMLAYTSRGQSYFIVSGINPTRLHIRIKGGLFGETKKACQEIYRNALREEKRARSRIRRQLFRNRQEDTPYITLEEKIDVFEPAKRSPTIEGHIIRSATVETFRERTYEFLLMILTLGFSVILFFFTPTIVAPWLLGITNSLTSRFALIFTQAYIQGALERVFSATLVTSMVTAIGILFRILQLRRLKPIKWDTIP